MRIDVGKLIAFLFGQLLQLGSDLAWHLTAAAEDHAPHGIVHIDITALALLHREQVHQRDVLGILREWCHQWWIAHTRPYVSNLVEELDEQIVDTQFGLALLLAQIVDGAADAAQVAHHRTHHTAGESAAQQE